MADAEPTIVPVEFDSLPGVKLRFESAGLVAGWKLFLGEQELKPTRGKISVPLPDGGVAELVVKPKLDQSVAFEHQGETVAPIEGLPIPLLVLGALPMGLVGVGGALGGALGAVAFGLNMVIARVKQPIWVRILYMLLTTAAAYGGWVGIAAAIA